MIDPILERLSASRRPLVVCDVDEVVLEFLDPFDHYLNSVGHRLHPDSFRLHGNIRSLSGDIAAADDMVERMQEEFFASQDRWQTLARGVDRALDSLSRDADIVFLTAMPPRHHDIRRALLDRHRLDFPMIATEEPKGPVVAGLIGGRDVPAVFVDDIAHNHHSVRSHAPGCILMHLMANRTFRALAPALDDDVVIADDWSHAERLIREHLGLMRA
ncbi:MAG: hypothetical protein KDJ87_00275 [Rhizobiaceae bacterium]|nr:hypothetical protein [Rhizobiaceae bacterium]